MYSALMPEYDQAHRGRASGAKDTGGAAAALGVFAVGTSFLPLGTGFLPLGTGFLPLGTGFLPLGTGFRAALAAEDSARLGVAGRRVERALVLMRGFCLRRCGFCVLFAAGPARV
jgi:hypothetical protein